MVSTIKFSQFASGGDLSNGATTVGLDGTLTINTRFNNPWTFLPSGTTAQRPAPSSAINYRLRLNTDTQNYEFYDDVLGMWVVLQDTTSHLDPYIIYKASTDLPNAQNLGFLSNGMLKQTVSVGTSTVSIGINGTDFYGPGFVIPGTDGGTGHNNGVLTINLGSATTGYVLTSDSSGNATWQILGASSGAVLLNPSGDQTILNAHNLIMATGSMVAPTVLAGNLSLSGNTLSSTNSNGNINLIPNGTGMILGLGSTAFTTRPGVEIQKVGNEVNYTAGTFVNTAGNAPKFNAYKSRSITIGAFVPVQTGDDLGIFSGWGDDGTTFRQAAQIKVLAGSTISSGVVSGTLQINTSSTLGVLTNAVSIDDAQIVSLTNPLPSSSGGTGVNNGSRTITLGGSLSTIGAFTAAFTMTGNTAVTFPTSGTLLTSAGAVTSITGTANQVISSASTGAVTLSLPQSIATSSAVTFGSLAFSTTSGIIGTTTNDSAATGSVGEYVESIILIGSPTNIPTSNAAINVTSISLTAGDWDVWGTIGFDVTGVSATRFLGWISTTSATLPALSSYTRVVGVIISNEDYSIIPPTVRLKLSGTTTVYLSAQCTFTATTLNSYGGIFARRRR